MGEASRSSRPSYQPIREEVWEDITIDASTEKILRPVKFEDQEKDHPLLRHGSKQGKPLHISEVPSGLACGCVCPSCGDRLIAKKGQVREHHFAHAAGSDCPTAVETALHLVAKEILARRKEIVLPSVEIEFLHYRSPMIIVPGEGRHPLTSVALEQRLGDIIPDVIARVKDRPLLIEVRVTHGIDDEKLERIKSLGISTVEIDLSAAPRDLPWKDLEELVVEGGPHKRWVYNAFAERHRKRILSEATLRPKFSHGFATLVKGCPLPRYSKPYWVNGKPYAHVMYECAYCEHYLGDHNEEYAVVCGA